jgi:hypothetical protein
LRDIGLLSLDGNVIAPTATLTAGSIALNGNITAASALALQAAGGITQNAGIITTGLLSTGDATDGAITLNDANQVASLGTISGIAGLSLNDSAALSLTGPVTLPDVLVLHAASIGQAGGTISAAELTGSTTGAAVLTAAGNDIPTLGNFAAGGGLNLVDSAPLDLAGIIGTGPVLDLSDTGDINQTGGAVTTALLNANAANIALGQANAIAALGDISTNDLLINGAAALNGPLNASNATISNTTGNLALNGNARVAGTLALQTNGEIIQARGSAINAGTGVYTAGNGIELDGVDNFAGALNLTASNGNITQNAGQTTYDPGQISAASADITAARGSILLDGATLIDGDLNLAAAGSIIHNYGALVAGTLTGNAGTLAQFTGLTEIGTLGSFIMRDSNFDLDNTGSLTLTGPLVADAINITVNGSLLLDGTPDGGIFIAGPIEPKLTQNPQPGDSDITVNGTGSSITQTGQFNINNGGTYGAGLNNTNYPSATLFLSLTSGGLITLAPAPPLTDNGLQAPSVELFLYDGNGGLATGNVNLRALTVLNGSPTVTVNLSGYIDNVGGEAGAAKGFVNPFSQPGYRFNACPIGSVNCTILPIESLPPGNPLQNFDLTQRKRKKLNHDVHLPSVATRDF